MRNMGWMSRVAVLVMLRYISLSSGIPHSLPVAQDGYMEENAVSSDVDSNIGKLIYSSPDDVWALYMYYCVLSFVVTMLYRRRL